MAIKDRIARLEASAPIDTGKVSPVLERWFKKLDDEAEVHSLKDLFEHTGDPMYLPENYSLPLSEKDTAHWWWVMREPMERARKHVEHTIGRELPPNPEGIPL